MFRRAGRVVGCLLGVIGVLALLAVPARADTVTVPAYGDCNFDEEHPKEKDCANETLVAGFQGTDAVWTLSTAVGFDLTGVPSGAHVTSARLFLYGTYDGGGVERARLDAVNPDDPDHPIDSAEFVDGAPAGWASWDVTDLARPLASTSGSASVPLAPAAGTPLIPVRWEFESSVSASVSLRPYVEIEYFTECPSDPYSAAQVTNEDDVFYWNEVLLDVIRQHQPSSPPPPTRISRAAAMMNVAIFDTMNSAFFAELEDDATGSPSSSDVCGWEKFVVLADAEPGVNVRQAVAVAARDVLLEVYPGFSTFINGEFSRTYGSFSDPDADDLGAFVADEVIASRSSDGSSASMPYTPASTTPGAWRWTPTLSTESFCRTNTTSDIATPGWGNVTPFTLTSGSQFRLPFPGGFTTYASFLASSLYDYQVDVVRNYGNRDELASDRTSDQTEAAFFWANDLIHTYKPPGQLLEHTRLVVETQPAAITSGDPEDFFSEWSRQGIRVARLYALVSLGMADGAIAAWDMKFQTPIDLWRPVTAIREDATDPDPSWEPLSRDRDEISFSPCFPAWVSGHATFGGAWSRIMENEFEHAEHADPFPITLTTEDPHSETAPGVFDTRVFDSFAQAAEENAASRIWLGVHYPIDAEGGLITGRSVADQVSREAIGWRQECVSWGCAVPIS